MTWILIIGLYIGGAEVAVTSVEFENEAACKSAGKTMAREWSRGSVSLVDQSRWVCVPKG